jgi:F0F1-type ATP synthase membrane subunit b/b'
MATKRTLRSNKMDGELEMDREATETELGLLCDQSVDVETENIVTEENQAGTSKAQTSNTDQFAMILNILTESRKEINEKLIESKGELQESRKKLQESRKEFQTYIARINENLRLNKEDIARSLEANKREIKDSRQDMMTSLRRISEELEQKLNEQVTRMNNNSDSLSQRTDSQVRTLTETFSTNQNQFESNLNTLLSDVASLHTQISERQDLLENYLDSTRSEIRVVKNTVDKLQKVNQQV